MALNQSSPSVVRARELAAEGKSRDEIAALIGVHSQTVYLWGRRFGFAIPRKTAERDDAQALATRSTKIVAMFRQGLTLEKIGAEFGISRERVRQVLKKQGLVGMDGGQQLRAKQEQVSRIARLEAKCVLQWGVSREEHKARRADGTVRAFESQRNHARMRAIGWSLTFVQWLSIWLASGKLEQRGRGIGKYCMSRIKDEGGYAVGNVHIQLCSDNSREATKQWIGKPKKKYPGVFCLYPGTSTPYVVRLRKISIANRRFATAEEGAAFLAQYIADNGIKRRNGLGNGRGWTFVKSMKSRPYFVQAAGRRLGYYATQEEAEAVYRAHIALMQQARQAIESGAAHIDPVSTEAVRHGPDGLSLACR